MRRFKIGDILLIGVIIALSVFIALFNGKKGSKVIIESNGKIIKQLDIHSDYEFVYENKYKNVITIKDGFAFISESNCPDKSCVLSGKISSGDQVICCLPNELIVRVAGTNEKVDVISG